MPSSFSSSAMNNAINTTTTNITSSRKTGKTSKAKKKKTNNKKKTKGPTSSSPRRYRSTESPLDHLHAERDDDDKIYRPRGYSYEKDHDGLDDIDDDNNHDVEEGGAEVVMNSSSLESSSSSPTRRSVSFSKRILGYSSTNDEFDIHDFVIDDDDDDDAMMKMEEEQPPTKHALEEAVTLNSGISSYLSVTWARRLGGGSGSGQESQQQSQQQLQSQPKMTSPHRDGRNKGGEKRTSLDNDDVDDDEDTQSTGSTNKLMRKQYRQQKLVQRHEEAITDALGRRSFHIPGNTTCYEDWVQYMCNTHPLLALGCSDYKRNPKRHGIIYRLIVLVTSITVGFTAVNAAVWWSYHASQNDENPNNTNSDFFESLEDLHPALNATSITSVPIISLFTWMAFVHAVHDCLAWYGCISLRKIDDGFKGLMFCGLWWMVWAGAATTFVALLYTSSSSSSSSSQTSESDIVNFNTDPPPSGVVPDYDHLTERQQNDYVSYSQQGGGGEDVVGSYDYVTILIYLGIEVGISWFLFFPLVATTLFSGILGCCGGCVPVFGGRPRDVEREKIKAQNSKGPMGTLEALADYDDSTVDIRALQQRMDQKKSSRFM